MPSNNDDVSGAIVDDLSLFIFDPPLSPTKSGQDLSPFSASFLAGYSVDLNLPDSFFDEYLQSVTVNPVEHNTPSLPSPTRAPQMVTHQSWKHQQISGMNVALSVPIEILSQPRAEFRPRTEKEYLESSHFIRCSDGSQYQYPTIKIDPSWPVGETIIRVTLVDLEGAPHLYTIDSKLRKDSQSVFKMNKESHTLYFHVTPEEHRAGKKTFMIEHIKNGQRAGITKKDIQARNLKHSKLQFTRFSLLSDGSYLEDKASTVCSDEMTENYGCFGIVDIFPRYGPMRGNEKVCIQTKGTLPDASETSFILKVTKDNYQWTYQMSTLEKNGKNFYLYMPPYPDIHLERAETIISIEYKQEPSVQTQFTYLRCLDRELNANYSNGLTTSDIDLDLPSDDNYSGTQSTRSSTKRLRQ